MGSIGKFGNYWDRNFGIRRGMYLDNKLEFKALKSKPSVEELFLFRTYLKTWSELWFIDFLHAELQWTN